MIIYALGLLDLWTAAILIPMHFSWIGAAFALAHSVYLFIKGIAFWGNIYSFLDICISVYILFMILGMSNLILTLFSMLYLIQKAYFCFKF